MKIGILMGGPSAERNISLKTGKAVAIVCRELGHEILEFLCFSTIRDLFDDGIFNN